MYSALEGSYSYRIVHLTNLSKYLYNRKSEIKVNVREVKNSNKKKTPRLSLS